MVKVAVVAAPTICDLIKSIFYKNYAIVSNEVAEFTWLIHWMMPRWSWDIIKVLTAVASQLCLSWRSSKALFAPRQPIFHALEQNFFIEKTLQYLRNKNFNELIT